MSSNSNTQNPVSFTEPFPSHIRGWTATIFDTGHQWLCLWLFVPFIVPKCNKWNPNPNSRKSTWRLKHLFPQLVKYYTRIALPTRLLHWCRGDMSVTAIVSQLRENLSRSRWQNRTVMASSSKYYSAQDTKYRRSVAVFIAVTARTIHLSVDKWEIMGDVKEHTNGPLQTEMIFCASCCL